MRTSIFLITFLLVIAMISTVFSDSAWIGSQYPTHMELNPEAGGFFRSRVAFGTSDGSGTITAHEEAVPGRTEMQMELSVELYGPQGNCVGQNSIQSPIHTGSTYSWSGHVECHHAFPEQCVFSVCARMKGECCPEFEDFQLAERHEWEVEDWCTIYPERPPIR